MSSEASEISENSDGNDAPNASAERKIPSHKVARSTEQYSTLNTLELESKFMFSV